MNIFYPEIIVLSGIYIIGLLFSSLILNKENSYFIAVISLFSGISLCFFIFFLLLLTLNKINLEALIFGGLIQIIVLIMVFIIKNKGNMDKVYSLFLTLPVFIFFVILFQNYDFNLFCGDTFLLSRCAKKFSINPELFKGNVESLSSWGGLFLLIQHVSYELRLPYFPSLLPLLLLSFVLSFQMIIYKSLKYMDMHYFYRLGFSLLASLLLITTPIFLSIVLLLHTNVFLTYYLFLFMGFFWIGRAALDERWNYLAYLFLLTSAFCRVESPIYSTIFLFCMIYQEHYEKGILAVRSKLLDATTNKCTDLKDLHGDNDSSLKYFFVCTFLVLIGAWYSFLYIMDADSDILSKGRASFLAAVFLFLPACFLILETKKFLLIKRNFLNIISIFSILGCVSIPIFLSKELFASLKGIYSNMSSLSWQGIIIFILGSLIVLTLRKRKKIFLEKSIITFIFLFILSILVFSFFRAPYYKATYDSSNRLFVTLIPIIIFYLTLKLTLTFKKRDPQEEVDPKGWTD